MLRRNYLSYCSFLLASLCWGTSSPEVNFEISGLQGPILQNAETALISCIAEKKPLSNQIIQECYRTGPLQIEKAIEPFGYFHSTVKPMGITHDGHKWTAHFQVNPGNQVHITTIKLALVGPGKNNPDLLKHLANFPLQVGMPFESPTYEKARDSLLQAANQAGWLEATFSTKEVRINPEKLTAQVMLTLQTGKRFYFGKVYFNPTPFSQAFLERFISFQQGRPFSSDQLFQLQEDLSSSGYFNEVVVTPNLEQTRHQQVPIHITLTPPKAKSYVAGIGYGTFTGFRTTLGVEYRRIGNEGQHFTVQMRLSTVLKGLSAKYFIPGKNPLTDKYVIAADAQKFVPENGHSFSETLSISKIMTRHLWQHTLSLNYLNERYKVDTDPTESGRELYPDYIAKWVRKNDALNPTFATSIQFGIRGANEHILSFISFIQGDIKAKQLFSLTEASHVLIRGSFGYTVVNDLARLPLTLRYFTGGLESVRGFAYSSIGPGRYLESASLEYQHRLVGHLDGAVFYDLGTATDHLNTNLMRSVGIGLIYRSIIGPVRLYFAKPLTEPTPPPRIKPNLPFGVEFSLGPDF